MSLRAIMPALWAGVQKGGSGSPLVCQACPDWESCADVNRCSRATAADYSSVFGERLERAADEESLAYWRERAERAELARDEAEALAARQTKNQRVAYEMGRRRP